MTTQTSTKWNDYLIRDFSKVKGGKRLPKGQFVQDKKTTHPYIRVTDMHSDRLDTSDIKYITDEQFEKIKRYTISSDDVYVSNAGTIGLVGKVPNWLSGANLTENALKITDIDKGKVSQDFIIYFLRSSVGQDQIKARTGGSSQPKLALTRLADVTVTAPDVPSQIRIIGVLSAYDGLIENNNRRIKILEGIAQKIYAEWFVNFRFPGYEKARFGKDGLPEGWYIEKLSDYVELNRGVSYSSKNLSEATTDIPLLSLKSFLRKGGYRVDGIKYFKGKLKENQSASGGELLIANTDLTQEGDIIGAPLLVPSKYQKVAFTHHVYAVRLKSESNISTEYLYYHMMQDSYRGYVKGHGNGTTVLGLSRESIYNYKLTIPEMEVIKMFRESINPIRSEIEKLEEVNEKLVGLRDFLIPQLVTGKLEIKS